VQHSLTIRGDGGEAELKPDSDCEVRWIRNGELSDEMWGRVFPRRVVKDESLDPQLLLDVWRGNQRHEYGEAAVISTLSVLLILLGKASGRGTSIEIAKNYWDCRNKTLY